MKKVTAVFLSMMLLVSLAACGQSGTGQQENTQADVQFENSESQTQDVDLTDTAGSIGQKSGQRQSGNMPAVQPGEYRQTTVAVGSFSPNPLGLYDMHGNVGEWTWDIYGAYPTDEQTDPVGADSGARRVYRGGGWNDFAKNMRSVYRAMMDQDKGSFNIGIRLVRNAAPGSGNVAGTDVHQKDSGTGSNILIAYFSWGGNTRGIAEEIQNQTGADLFEITLVNPYSSDYNTVLDEAQRDQNEQARPELASHVENMDDYNTIILGYPNWWASIPMPVASFLEEYDFSGKTIIPFCSHGGGRFGQSLTAIAKLAPDAAMGEALPVHYSGGNSLSEDIAEWLESNRISGTDAGTDGAGERSSI